MLSECQLCGEPLFEYISHCPRCQAGNRSYRGDTGDPTVGAPWPERASYALGAGGLLLSAILGLFSLFDVSLHMTTPGLVRDFLISVAVGVSGLAVPLRTDVLASQSRGPVGRVLTYGIILLAVLLLSLPARRFLE
jgi:hypothetical protein